MTTTKSPTGSRTPRRRDEQGEGGPAGAALEDLMQAALVATPERKDDALRVLRGQVRVLDPAAEAFVTEPYLTLREVARRVGISTCTLWRWGVPGHDLGGRRRFRASEVLAYL